MKRFSLLLIHIFLPIADVVFECVAGLWGPQCNKKCGNCEGGPEFCQVYDGLCMNGCASGYKGVYCKEFCESGLRGQYCHSECGHCAGSSVCNSGTGKCELGCERGYQMPYCNIPCEFDKWGDGCSKPCQCTIAGNPSCGCHFQTGHCHSCGPRIRYFPVKEPDCLNELRLSGGYFDYEPPNVLDFPYKPILAGGSIVALFVFGNFLWWWFIVRTPHPKEPPPEIQREKKIPRHLRKKIKYKSTLAELLRKRLQKQKASALARDQVERSESVESA